MIFSKKKRSPGIILIFTLFSLALLSMIFVYCLENRMHRGKFYSLAMKAGGFLDVKKNGKDLEVDVRGLLDLERWSMLNYLSACFYNAGTSTGTYQWYYEDSVSNALKALNIREGKSIKGTDCKRTFNLLRMFFAYCTGSSFERKTKGDGPRSFSSVDHLSARNMSSGDCYENFEDVVKDYFYGPLPIEYSDNVKKNRPESLKGKVVHNSHLKVEAKISFADNKLPFNEKFKEEAKKALYECIETAYPYKDYKKSVGWMGGKKDPGPREIDGITYFNNGAAEIMTKVGKLIEDYDKKREGYTLTFSDLMSIDELRLLIQGNFEDDVLDAHKWAKDGFKEENAKELEALIRDTFVFHDIYAVNFLLANNFVQDAFVKVHIPFEVNQDLEADKNKGFEHFDEYLKYFGREKDYESKGGKREVTSNIASRGTIDSAIYIFDKIDSLSDKELISFFCKDVRGAIVGKSGNLADAILQNGKANENFLGELGCDHVDIGKWTNDQLKTFIDKVSGNIRTVSDGNRNGAVDYVRKYIKESIREILKKVLKNRVYAYMYYNECLENRIVAINMALHHKDMEDFHKKLLDYSINTSFDFLAQMCKTSETSRKNIRLIRARNKQNGSLNLALNECDGLTNLQILKILCKKLSVFFAKDKKDKKLYLFPYPYGRRFERKDSWRYYPGSISGDHPCVCYDHDYTADLQFKFDEKYGQMIPDIGGHKIEKKCVYNLLLRKELFDVDGKLNFEDNEDISWNPWDRVRSFCSFSNYANVKLRIYDDKLPFIRKETDDVICFEIPDKARLELFTKDAGVKGTYKGGFKITPLFSKDFD